MSASCCVRQGLMDDRWAELPVDIIIAIANTVKKDKPKLRLLNKSVIAKCKARVVRVMGHIGIGAPVWIFR